MQALVVHGHEVRYESAPDPIILDRRDVIVTMKGASICGSDLHLLDPSWDAPREVYGIGHEAVGEIVEVGKDVRTLKVGDEIMLSGIVACGLCRSCLAGELKRCENKATDVYGLGQSLEGCQAEAIRVPAADFNAQVVPEGVSREQAVLLTDGLITAFGACVGAEIRPGNSVAVIGLGPIGLMATELAVAMGASIVYAVDPIAERRAWATDLGAVALPPDDLPAVISEKTSGRMIDSVVEAVGSPKTIDLAMQIVGVGRTVDVLGAGQFDMTIPFNAAVNGVTVRANMLTEIPAYWPEVIPLLQSGRIHPERVFTHTFSLPEGEEAYRQAIARENGLLKILLN
ncbi:MAG: alcohol dehydrogenase [Hyphomicrobiales bacterium]|nr:MAG: alcohol dehydrogenase [Hyphomicrobiales bacterium]